jgi:patatin-like phospholipase/acyl hydrolase
MHSSGLVETFLKSRFPDTSQGLDMQVGLSKDNSLRPDVPLFSMQRLKIFIKERKKKERKVKEKKGYS